jgi:methionine-rich copper-binding protein CopC
MKVLKYVCFAGVCLMTPTALFAHTSLATSNPTDGAVLEESPQQVELGFTEQVRFLKFSLNGVEVSSVPVTFKPSASVQDVHSVPLSALGKGSYTVNWSVMGSDGHLVENSFGFSVGDAAAASPHADVDSHAEHAH